MSPFVKTKSKGSFPTVNSAFKMLYLTTQEVQNKWKTTKLRNWSEIMEKYTK